MSINEQIKELESLQRELIKKQIELYSKPQKNSRELKTIRKRIAVIETIVRETHLREKA